MEPAGKIGRNALLVGHAPDQAIASYRKHPRTAENPPCAVLDSALSSGVPRRLSVHDASQGHQEYARHSRRPMSGRHDNLAVALRRIVRILCQIALGRAGIDRDGLVGRAQVARTSTA